MHFLAKSYIRVSNLVGEVALCSGGHPVQTLSKIAIGSGGRTAQISEISHFRVSNLLAEVALGSGARPAQISQTVALGSGARPSQCLAKSHLRVF